jgi:acyl dehydratase
MALNASAVGMTMKCEGLTVTTRRALAFAAAFADVTSRELDDAAAGGLLACPCLCVTYEWICTKLMRDNDRLGLTPDEARRGVHAGQDTTFHAPIPAGAQIRVEAQVEAIRPTRAGGLLASRMRILDDATGTPYTTSRITSIFRGTPVEGSAAVPAAGESPSAPPPPGSSPTMRIAIPRGFAHVYSECADIWNPIHTERRVALQAGLPDIIVHGTALWALAGRTIVAALGGRDSHRLRRLACRFSGMVIPGAGVTLQYAPLADDRNRIAFVMRTQSGERALSDGIAELSGT